MGRSKYGAERTMVDGLVFDSKAEARRYAELRLLERAGEIHGLVADKKMLVYPLTVNGLLVCRYEADFFYCLPDGREVVEDSKGYRTREYTIKRKLFRAVYGFDITETGQKRRPRRPAARQSPTARRKR